MNSTEECSEMMEKDVHVTFLEMMYHLLPSPYESQETNHMTLAYFIISGLDILNALHSVEKDAVANWVLSFQVHPRPQADLKDGQFYGFHGSKSSQFPPDEKGVLLHNNSHLASTYCALAILKIVGYDLSKLDSESILTSMMNLQQPDGSFMPIHTGGETDLRFVYCAAAICFLLDNWSGMDKEKTKDYILHCQSYDGGFGLVPGAESHGGATYCAIASLRLMGFIEENILSSDTSSSLLDVPLLLDWILHRQGNDGGFQGRPNKPSDTCYAFWQVHYGSSINGILLFSSCRNLDMQLIFGRIGAVLRILGGCNLVDNKALRGFLLSCQYQYGGFSKFPGEFPDLYHSYYGFTAFSLLEESGLKSLCSELGISEMAAMGF